MRDWNFIEEEPMTYELLTAGNHRVRIKDVIEGISANGRDRLEVKMTVSKYGNTLSYYLTFNDDTPETQKMSNRNFTAFFRSFGIQAGNFNYNDWKGKIGVVYINVESYNGEDRNYVKWCVEPQKQVNIAPWVEPTSSKVSTSTPSMGYTGGSSNVPY